MEHISHVGHVRGVEVAHVKVLQIFAINKHVLHGSHVVGDEPAHVKGRYAFALPEHVRHAGHILGIEVTHVNLEQSLNMLVMSSTLEVLRYLISEMDWRFSIP